MEINPVTAPLSLLTRLQASRQELLDLGLRNPLLNFRPSPARGVMVTGEQSAAVYEGLVRRAKTMYFLASPEARPVAAKSLLGAEPGLEKEITEAALGPAEAEVAAPSLPPGPGKPSAKACSPTTSCRPPSR
ncbi:DUF4011 domain-containing protein [Hymenobacter cellulosilyticus]|uniref:DUF4011 domain-containing protein n=1 Tax=Hymenobacter cellulosilyticus TaxID=2932248 RepID=UPI0021D45C9D|nr:DUF4011 domain-containing protein [Hymenobacter cellulosilyticus]